ncbi:hypothetical protein [Richelia intracellularis]|uniref:hypothetical protein n=1 Tax=Richelia intracellularis TaxID=1164990 RepID=UPI0005C4FB6B|nr:hypothetical protein [Richelia intracellularis]
MEYSKIVAIVTGVISILLAIAYLVLVQLLDLRGEMKPAPISSFSQSPIVIAFSLNYKGSYPYDTNYTMSIIQSTSIIG